MSTNTYCFSSDDRSQLSKVRCVKKEEEHTYDRTLVLRMETQTVVWKHKNKLFLWRLYSVSFYVHVSIQVAFQTTARRHIDIVKRSERSLFQMFVGCVSFFFYPFFLDLLLHWFLCREMGYFVILAVMRLSYKVI